MAVALAYEATFMVCWHLANVSIVHNVVDILFRVIVPVAVLVINVVVVVQVRRAVSNAAANLGVQPHHQSTSGPNSSVPTVMLIATSIIYVLVCGTVNVLIVLKELLRLYRDGITRETADVLDKCKHAVSSLVKLVFAYNFYIYLVTGKQFRSELRELFRRCFSSPSSPAHAPAVFVDSADDNRAFSQRVQPVTTF